jgi:16S rRNA (cytidine1402-2'-O)-methyltransferase
MSGKLYLIPTPIDGESKLCEENFKLLFNACLNKENSVFAVEDPKPARRAWIRFGLDRGFIDDFVYYNEQTRAKVLGSLIKLLKQGKNVYLMSDCGLPAFCDPGVRLVNNCHESGIVVTAGKFNNSVVLALALSGFSHDKFNFYGFAPRKAPEREIEILDFLRCRYTSIIMDTPYRLEKLLSEIRVIEAKNNISNTYLLAMDLNKSTERLLRGKMDQIKSMLTFDKKSEFILVRDQL